MKFFHPLTPNEAEAEQLWEGMRLLLADRGLPTEPRRIHSLYCRSEGEARVLQVGVEDSDTFEPVVSIYRAANAPFYLVVTPAHGIIEGAPMPVAAEGTRAILFDEPKPSRPRKLRRRRS